MCLVFLGRHSENGGRGLKFSQPTTGCHLGLQLTSGAGAWSLNTSGQKDRFY